MLKTRNLRSIIISLAVDGGFRDCGGFIQASVEPQEIFSPGFPQGENYPDSAICIWTIESFPGTVINVAFQVTTVLLVVLELQV